MLGEADEVAPVGTAFFRGLVSVDLGVFIFLFVSLSLSLSLSLVLLLDMALEPPVRVGLAGRSVVPSQLTNKGQTTRQARLTDRVQHVELSPFQGPRGTVCRRSRPGLHAPDVADMLDGATITGRRRAKVKEATPRRRQGCQPPDGIPTSSSFLSSWFTSKLHQMGSEKTKSKRTVIDKHREEWKWALLSARQISRKYYVQT